MFIKMHHTCRSDLRFATNFGNHLGVGNWNSLLLHVEFASPMGVILWSSDKSLSHRILITITDDFLQRFIAADPVIIVIDLPDWTGSHEKGINLVRRESFEGLDEPRQGLLISKLEDCVDMVWHNHDAYPFEAIIGFKPVKAFKNNVRDAPHRQDRCSVVGSERNGIVGTRYRFSTSP